MVDFGAPTKGGKWVCPNDRQLALRAKLHTGWSVKTHDLQEYGRKPQVLNETEQNIIKQVIQRAEILDQKEQERVGRLVDRLDNMKRNIMGNGTTQCILCGDSFRLFGASNFMCNDCKKLVCDKCGVEIASASQESIWLCKICSETREMWKKSGAWFFKGLPKYKLPEKKVEKYGPRKVTRPGLAKNNWSKLSVLSPVNFKALIYFTIYRRNATLSNLDRPPSIFHGYDLIKVKNPDKMIFRFSCWGFAGTLAVSIPSRFGPDIKAKTVSAKISYSKGSSSSELNKPEADEESSSEEEKKTVPKTVKTFEEPSKAQAHTSTLHVAQVERAPRSPGTMSTVSGSQFFNTSSDSGVGESERNPGSGKYRLREGGGRPSVHSDVLVTEKPVSQKYKREVSNESSESNQSTFSRQTSSTFSESQPNLTSSTTYLSSVNQSYERLSLSCEQKPDPCTYTHERYPWSFSSAFGKKASIESEKPGYGKSQQGKAEASSYGSQRQGRKLPIPGCRVAKPEQERKEYEVQKLKKKVSIDFGKAAAFLRHPLKSDKKKGSKAAEHSSSESVLGSSTDSTTQEMWRKCGREGVGNVESCYESGRMRQDSQSELGANHWMSQESEMDAADSMAELNTKWRESLSSLSRDYYWTEDQMSISSSASTNPFSSSEGVRSQNAHLGSLELSIRHDSSRMSISCTVHRGEGLRGTDVHGLADPFCKLGLLPSMGKWKYLRTKTVHRTINPEFNDTISFHGVTEADVQKTILHIMVLDDDQCGNCLLGEVRLPLFKIGSKATNVRLYLEKPYQAVQQEQEESEESVWEERRWSRRKY